ncbi:MAG: hypothetical protein A2525_03415 [Sulfurimonas sp. RIFOXYD12_FULL_36_11]|nr:MAG: hypothetical protein A2540_06375 [Sulfurimonas sp. RIFOXYD2_FULL_37_8]OHE20506.1 MAG: hypothetical protein A2525_03415 [Sulfurimonas sp. RIFOXYD12_FULL_36_11]
MKIFISIFFIITMSYAKVYYAKVEPFELREISSNISGLVVYADENLIGKRLADKPYIKIDSEIDQKDLRSVKEKLIYIKSIIEINEAVLVNLEESLGKKRENYKKIEPLKVKSSVEKDREFYDLMTSENLYLSIRKEIQNLKIEISNLKLREAQLERNISDKNLTAQNFILYEILVKAGQVVGVATPLAKVADDSKALLTIYLDEQDVLNAKKSTLYIDGEKSPYKISRLLNIADGKNISKYMAQIIIESPKLFSKLVKVELKDE